MTQAPDTEAIELSISSCETCDQLFLISPRRQTCPTCGGSAGLTFFEFEADGSGVRLKESILQTSIATALPQDVARSQLVEPQDVVLLSIYDRVLVSPAILQTAVQLAAFEFLVQDEVNAEALADVFVDAGAEPEAAIIAVGRLMAVRDFLEALLPKNTPEEPGSPETASSDLAPGASGEPLGEPVSETPSVAPPREEPAA